ncbi:DUF3037 domain-containing protein [Cupriavidus pampae]|uniref:DUF3037 domain-containing protein n=1 Tax=Cupriavidus pampae TaxID=659251 RepID=A0ABN7XUD8_9BURK|nr:DUF3037 domain-containing protein [Cupriavidus pampae]CAG9164505.1 hypothetical protein LMG32289_00848 [Cupriavidus pampae]
MKYACQYAIIRFRPYVETEEFANVGVVLACPKTGYFDYQLLPRVRRIKAFFEELDASVYRTAREAMRAELARIKELFERSGGTVPLATRLFEELVRPRESMIRFAEVRVILTESPAEELGRVYEHVVGRSFATKVYQEQIIEKHIKGMLRAADLSALFKSRKLGNDAYHATFPLVRVDRDDVPVQAIKPLHLAHDDASAIFDHGWEWLGKVKRLHSEGLLPKQVMFAVNAPAADDALLARTYTDVISELSRAPNTSVASYEDAAAIMKFVKH